MTETPATGEEVSAEARMIAAQVRAQAAGAPSAEELAQITVDALNRHREDMTPGEIRQIAVTALTHAQHVSFLLGRLAGLLGEDDGETP